MSEETKQPSTDTDGKKVSAAPKSAAKKPAARKTTAKKPVAKKPVIPKPAVKRAAPKKTAATAAKKPTSTAAKKPSATKSAAAKRSTAARKAAPVKTGAANPAAKPAEPVSASAEKASPSAAKVGPEASDTYEHARADAKAEQHSSRTDHSDDPYSAENLAADFKEKDWKEVFVRAAFTVFYVFAGWIAIALGFTFTVIQFLIHLVTGHPNDVVKNAILCIGQYIGDIAAYVSFDSDERPFPFGKDLPDGK